ncbi:MAG: hypothetical protein ACYTEX_05205 [Planctomycetota bacterium]
MTNTHQMFGHFQDHWTDQGGLMEYAWQWWFDGTYRTNRRRLGTAGRLRRRGVLRATRLLRLLP